MGFNKKDNAYKALNIGEDRVDENSNNNGIFIGSNNISIGISNNLVIQYNIAIGCNVRTNSISIGIKEEDEHSISIGIKEYGL